MDETTGITFEETITLQDSNYTSDTIISTIQEFLDTINTTRTKNYEIDININTGEIFFTSDDTMNINFNSKDTGGTVV